MKLLFHIIIILIFGYINSADAGTTVNGCGLMEYREPTSEEECKDNYSSRSDKAHVFRYGRENKVTLFNRHGR